MTEPDKRKIESLDAFGARFSAAAAAELERAAPTSRRWTIGAGVATVLVAASLSPVGSAVAEFVGIAQPGDEPSLSVGADGVPRTEAVVARGGAAPDGTPYEVVSYRGEKGELCVALEWPGSASTSGICPDVPVPSGFDRSGGTVTTFPDPGDRPSMATFQAYTGSNVDSVTAQVVRGEGTEAAEADLITAPEDVLPDGAASDPFNYLVVFLPDDITEEALATGEAAIEVTGFDAQGEETDLLAVDFGKPNSTGFPMTPEVEEFCATSPQAHGSIVCP